MSLITRCPACETMFKVVPDQLRISDGWVRCGQCDEIFDASASLVPDPGGVSAPSKDGLSHWALHSTAEAGAAAVATTRPDSADCATGGSMSLPGSTLQPETSGPNAPTGTPASPTRAEVDHPVATSSDLPDRGGRRVADSEPGAGVGAMRIGDPPTRLADLAPGRVTFLQEAAPVSLWERTGVRVTLAATCLLLLLVLFAQVVYVERDRIAAMEPATRPWLDSLCEWKGCTVGPLQRIESIVIESSSFNKLRGDVYRLNFSVRSTAPIDVGLPALELTLTDSQDQVLTRRVFLGTELGAKTSILPPGAEWHGSWAVSVKGAGINDHISGYRILAFYP